MKTIYSSSALALGITLMLPAAISSQPAEIFVSSSGEDSNPGSIDRPLRTLSAAKTLAAQLARTLRAPITVSFRGGEYFIDQPVVFTPEDSGSRDAPITFRSYPKEAATFTGGIKFGQGLRGQWTDTSIVDVKGMRRSVKVFHFDAATTQALTTIRNRARSENWNGGAFAFSSLYYGHQTELTPLRARHPQTPIKVNTSSFRVRALKPLVYAKIRSLGNLTLSLPPSARPEINFYRNWQAFKGTVNEISRSRKGSLWRFRIDGLEVPEGGRRLAEIHPTIQQLLLHAKHFPDDRGWLENALPFLDTPGEWFFDEDRLALYYLPRPNENIASLRFVLPITPRLLEFKGESSGPYAEDFERLVQFLRFERLGFRNTLWRYANGDGNTRYYGFSSNGYGLEGALDGNFISDLTFSGCEFERLGANAVSFGAHRSELHMYWTHFKSFARNIRFESNTFRDIGGTGIRYDHRIAPENEREIPPEEIDNNVITQNQFLRNGRVFSDTTPLYVGFFNRVTIDSNLIEDAPYSGMRVGFQCRQNKNDRADILRNRVIGVMKTLSDGGGLYVNGGQAWVEGNDLTGFKGTRTPGASLLNNKLPTPGVYLDDLTQYSVAVRNKSPSFLKKSNHVRVSSSGVNALRNEPGLQRRYAETMTHICNPKVPNQRYENCIRKFPNNPGRCRRIKPETRSRTFERPDWWN